MNHHYIFLHLIYSLTDFKGDKLVLNRYNQLRLFLMYKWTLKKCFLSLIKWSKTNASEFASLMIQGNSCLFNVLYIKRTLQT